VNAAFRFPHLLLPLCLCWLFACAAPRTQVVLLSDPDGGVGAVRVANPGGEQVIAQVNHLVAVTAPTAAPLPPRTVDETFIRRTFGDAITAQPTPPDRFILIFETGTTNLTAESMRRIADIKAAIAARRSTSVSVVGHTDRVGSAATNARLAQERAERVRNILISEDIDGWILEVSSHGESNPLVPTADEVAEPRNRRVEVTVR
jgi:outer membrane protein OmpA-like peptidoglycan-associated protein